MDGVAEFDAAFFGLSDLESTIMDPQQRLLLHSVAEALLQIPHGLTRKSQGVYLGIASSDYGSLVKAHTTPGKPPGFFLGNVGICTGRLLDASTYLSSKPVN